MNQIKPIETYYKGYRFRSRLEARWAVFFDALGIEWEYEKEGYDLGKAGYYLPDFWLPGEEAWAEVKANALTIDEKLKAIALCNVTNKPVILLVGVPVDDHSICDVLYPKKAWLQSGNFNFDEYRPILFSCIEPGITAARSARFEHGEHGGI